MELNSIAEINKFITSFEQSFSNSSDLCSTPQNSTGENSKSQQQALKLSEGKYDVPESSKSSKCDNGSTIKSSNYGHYRNNTKNEKKFLFFTKKNAYIRNELLENSNALQNIPLNQEMIATDVNSLASTGNKDFMEFKKVLNKKSKKNVIRENNHRITSNLNTISSIDSINNKSNPDSAIEAVSNRIELNPNVEILSWHVPAIPANWNTAGMSKSQKKSPEKNIRPLISIKSDIDEFTESQNKISQELNKISEQYEHLSDIDKLIMYEELKTVNKKKVDELPGQWEEERFANNRSEHQMICDYTLDLREESMEISSTDNDETDEQDAVRMATVNINEQSPLGRTRKILHLNALRNEIIETPPLRPMTKPISRMTENSCPEISVTKGTNQFSDINNSHLQVSSMDVSLMENSVVFSETGPMDSEPIESLDDSIASRVKNRKRGKNRKEKIMEMCSTNNDQTEHDLVRTQAFNIEKRSPQGRTRKTAKLNVVENLLNENLPLARITKPISRMMENSFPEISVTKGTNQFSDINNSHLQVSSMDVSLMENSVVFSETGSMDSEPIESLDDSIASRVKNRKRGKNRKEKIMEMGSTNNDLVRTESINTKTQYPIKRAEINVSENQLKWNLPFRRITRSMSRIMNNATSELPESRSQMNYQLSNMNKSKQTSTMDASLIENNSVFGTSSIKDIKHVDRSKSRERTKKSYPKSDIVSKHQQKTEAASRMKIERQIFEDCILFNDNLLKNLYEERYGHKFMTRKNGHFSEEESVVKRYKKGDMKIIKLKDHLRQKNYSKEDKIGKFLDKCSAGQFRPGNFPIDEISFYSERIGTPSTYETDDGSMESNRDETVNFSTEKEKYLLKRINKLSKDPTLIFSETEDLMPKAYDKKAIIKTIDQYLKNILDDFTYGRNPLFRFPRSNKSNCIFEKHRYVLKPNPEYATVIHGNATEEIKFNTMLFILNKIKYLLENNTTLTHREIFYQLKTAGFRKTQTYIDAILRSISRMLNVGLWSLNITANKGLVYGNLKLLITDGTTINCNVPGTLIPQNVMEIAEIHYSAYFILVVEKEAIFHKLLEENLPNKLAKPFILITGKGFPDVNTQLFLKKLWILMRIPVFIMVDADPDGIAIMLHYRFGSMSNAHISEYLAIPKAKWLGVFPTEISKFTLTAQLLNARDKKRIKTLLNSDCIKENPNVQLQLETLLQHGVKCGIESLIKSSMFLSNFYMSWKMYSSDFI